MQTKNVLLTGVLAALALANTATAETFTIDTEGAHASINFKIKHLGYSWLEGRFDTFGGEFTLDADNPAAAAVSVTIDTSSVNSNHAERDNHLRGEDFLFTSEYPQATFESTAVEQADDGSLRLVGDLTLRGVTKSIEIDAERVGGGNDPWGGYREGFVGTTSLALADFGIPFNLGPASREVYLTLNVEGIRR